MPQSKDLKQLLEVARIQPTDTALLEVQQRVRSAIELTKEILKRVEEAIAIGDVRTFANPQHERLLVKEELAALADLDRQVEDALSTHTEG
jgi:hypothetical protein